MIPTTPRSPTQDGTLTIDKAAVLDGQDDQEITYGDALPTFTATPAGLVNGDTQASENALTVCTSVPANSPAGTYAINCVTTDPNYAPISYTAGTLTSSGLTVTYGVDGSSTATG